MANPAPKETVKSKKPRRKGVNSGAALEARQAILNQIGMLGRSCISTRNMALRELAKKENAISEGYYDAGALSPEILDKVPAALPDSVKAIWNESKQIVRCDDASILKAALRDIQNQEEILNDFYKSVRPFRPRKEGHNGPDGKGRGSDQGTRGGRPASR